MNSHECQHRVSTAHPHIPILTRTNLLPMMSLRTSLSWDVVLPPLYLSGKCPSIYNVETTSCLMPRPCSWRSIGIHLSSLSFLLAIIACRASRLAKEWWLLQALDTTKRCEKLWLTTNLVLQLSSSLMDGCLDSLDMKSLALSLTSCYIDLSPHVIFPSLNRDHVWITFTRMFFYLPCEVNVCKDDLLFVLPFQGWFSLLEKFVNVKICLAQPFFIIKLFMYDLSN